MTDPLNAPLGARAVNPFYRFGESPLLPDLQDGPEAFGWLGINAQDAEIRALLTDLPEWAALAAILIDGGPPGTDYNFPNYDTLLVVNLHSTAFQNPRLGAGYDWSSTLVNGGPSRDSAFNGPGDESITDFPAGRIYATLIPEQIGTVHLKVKSAGIVLGTTLNDVQVGQVRYFVPESDADTLPDLFELTYFGALNTVQPNQDFDQDGHTNAEELKAGTSPTDAGSALRCSSPIPNQASGFDISFPAVAGRQYQLQYRSDLESGIWINQGPVIAASTSGQMAFTDRNFDGIESRFYRIVLIE